MTDGMAAGVKSKVLGTRMIRNKGARLWNALLPTLKNIKNRSSFTKNLKKSMKNNY